MRRSLLFVVFALSTACGGGSDPSGVGSGVGSDAALDDASHAIGDGGPDAPPGDGGTTPDTAPPVTTASPANAAIHQGPLTVTLSTDEPAVTHFTLDGSEPNGASPVYSAPLVIDRTRTLRFFSVDPAGNIETPRSELYRIDTVHLLLLEVGSN